MKRAWGSALAHGWPGMKRRSRRGSAWAPAGAQGRGGLSQHLFGRTPPSPEMPRRPQPEAWPCGGPCVGSSPDMEGGFVLVSEAQLPGFSSLSAPSHGHGRRHGTKGCGDRRRWHWRGRGRVGHGGWAHAHGCGQRGEAGETLGSSCFFQKRIQTWTPSCGSRAPRDLSLRPLGDQLCLGCGAAPRGQSPRQRREANALPATRDPCAVGAGRPSPLCASVSPVKPLV